MSYIRRVWGAFWLIVFLPFVVGEPVLRELRRSWRNMAIRRGVKRELITWRGIWREIVRGEP